MKKKRLKSWVISSIYTLSVGSIIASIVSLGSFLSSNVEGVAVSEYVPPKIVEQDEDIKYVMEPTNETVNHPYLSDKVVISKNFYDKNSEENEQVKSLIYYKNTYMENTGILYTASENFDVVSVLDGTVTSITKDEILGNVVEVSHTNELLTIYHCLDEVYVKAGDEIKQNDVIGKSGKVNIDDSYEHALLFEVNYKGSIINPVEFYNKKIAELMG